MQTYFYQLADYIGTQISGNETYLAYLSAEDSNFVRFNKTPYDRPARSSRWG